MTVAVDKALMQLEIQTAGGSIKPFIDTCALKNWIESQYPDWKNVGKITAVPEARIPRLFLHSDQLSKSLRTHFKTIVRGEDGEIRVFTELMKLKNNSEGLLIFPSLNGSEIFKNKVSELKVEIDILLIHPKKGVFIFNIKNVQNKRNGLNESEMREDFEKHTKFVRHLMNSHTTDIEKKAGIDVPIHNVVCNLHDNSELSWLKKVDFTSQGGFDKVLFFRKSDFDSLNDVFWSKLEKIPSVNQNSDLLDILVTRLIALSSMEGAVALIHDNLVSGKLQTIEKIPKRVNKFVDAQLADVANNMPDELVEKYRSALPKNSNGNKFRVILWTKEQLGIIVRVLKAVCNSSCQEQPKLKLLVKGSKGSGKTMLLMYIKQMISQILSNAEANSDNGKCEVKVCDGSGGASMLFFKSLPLESQDQVSLDWTKDVQKLIQDFQKQVSGAQLVLVDELHRESARFLRQIIFDCHCIVFSSDAKIDLEKTGFEILELTASLRATREIVKFCESFRKNCTDLGSHYPCNAKHNLCGNEPQLLQANNEKNLIDISIKIIQQNYSPSNLTLLASFMTEQINVEMKSKLRASNIPFYEAQKDIFGETSEAGKKAPIIFSNGWDVDGCEFGAVILLVTKRFSEGSRLDFGHDLFIAMSRATTRLIVISEKIDCLEEASPKDVIGPTSSDHLSAPGGKAKEATRPVDRKENILTPETAPPETIEDQMNISKSNENEKLILNSLPQTSGNVLVLGEFPTRVTGIFPTDDKIALDEIKNLAIYKSSGGRKLLSLFNCHTEKLLALVKENEIKTIVHLGRSIHHYRLYWATKSLLGVHFLDSNFVKEFTPIPHVFHSSPVQVTDTVLRFFQFHPKFQRSVCLPSKEDFKVGLLDKQSEQKKNNILLSDSSQWWGYWYQKAQECYKFKMYTLALDLYRDCFFFVMIADTSKIKEQLAILEDIVSKMRQVYVSLANSIRKNDQIYPTDELERVLLEALGLPDYRCDDIEPENFCESCLRTQISDAVLLSFWEEVLIQKKTKAERLEKQKQQDSVLKHIIKLELREGIDGNISRLMFEDVQLENVNIGDTEKIQVKYTLFIRKLYANIFAAAAAIEGQQLLKTLVVDDYDSFLEHLISAIFLSHFSVQCDPFSAEFYAIAIAGVRICKAYSMLIKQLKTSDLYEKKEADSAEL
ncbi:uncharacterized protein LOC142352962 [Convolutriloba macropyga]|uniref:uncharacterized protein LOC142352962 n=1 Tax=Convolutriloba macropyga TaxID=536237 RepID=UPI003F526DDA